MPEAGHQARRGLSDHGAAGPLAGPGPAAGASARSSTHERVEEVDADGRPVRVISRAEMRATNARHRACYVVVVDPARGVLVHQRAPWKDIWPSHWDLAFGGVCEPGESWAAAAVRELAEEAGIVVDAAALVDLGPVRYESAEASLVGRVSLVHSTGPFTFPDGEVVAHDWIPLAALGAWIARTPVCADSATVVAPLVPPSARPTPDAPGAPSRAG